MAQAPEQVTQILDAVGAGDAQAAEKLLPMVYEELRRLAATRMAKVWVRAWVSTPTTNGWACATMVTWSDFLPDSRVWSGREGRR